MIEYKQLQQLLEKNRTIPYPPIPILPKNKRYANLIYNDFAGELGELTAVTQYIYEHITLKRQEEISKILLEISIQEMNHLDMLGNIITMLGEKPIYMNSQGKEWNAKNVIYDINNFKHMMQINIQGEERAIKGYKNLISHTNNFYLKKIYERIILDENMHLEIFKKMKENF